MPSLNLPRIRPFKSPPLKGLILPPPPPGVGNIDLEIGAGAGLHAVTYALKHPERYLVALERTAERFGKFQRRISKYESLSNLLPLRADVQCWLAKNPHVKIENVFLYYPNPYPKASQANLRWHRSPFMDLLLTTMVPGGELLMATNIKAYHDEAMAYLSGYWKMNVIGSELAQDMVPRTHFEMKYMASSQSCYQIKAVKVASK